MRWLFGCFGCRRRSSSSSDRSPAPLPRKSHRRNLPPSHYAVPSRIPSSSSSSSSSVFRQNLVGRSVVEKQPAEKPSTSGNHQKDSGGDSLLVAVRTPEREKKKQKEKDCDHPLSQLDELEAELEDLRKQIDRETEDARRIREEVSILKSRDTLRKAQKEQQQLLLQQKKQAYEHSSNPDGGSSSSPWFASKSPNQTPVKSPSMAGLDARGPTPTLASNKSSARCMASSPSLQEEGGGKEDGSIPYARNSPLHKPKHLQPKEAASPDGQDLFDMPNERMRMHSGYSSQEEGRLLSAHDEEHNKRRAIWNGMASTETRTIGKSRAESSSSLGEASDDREIVVDALNLHSVDSTKRHEPAALPNESSIQMHFFGCETLSTISEYEEESGSESVTCSGSASSSSRREGDFDENDLHGDSIETEHNSQSVSRFQSDSIGHGCIRGGSTKTVLTNRSHSYAADEVSYAANKHDGKRQTQARYGNDSSCVDDYTEEFYSEESYSSSSILGNDDTEEKYAQKTLSVCRRYRDDDDDDGGGGGGGGSFSSSPSVEDSEETVSEELSPEPCFSPPVSHSQDRCRNSRYEAEESSSANTGTESGTQRFDKHHGRYRGSICEAFRSYKYTQMDDSDCDRTPLKLPECVATPPTTSAHGVGRNCSRLRNNNNNNRWPSSSVLTPVENVSQWMQLKQRDHSSCSPSQATSATKELDELAVVNHKKEKRRDENTHGFSASDCMSIRVDASFSQWAPKTEVDTIRVDASLSHWLGSSSSSSSSSSTKHVLGSSYGKKKNSSSEEGGVMAAKASSAQEKAAYNISSISASPKPSAAAEWRERRRHGGADDDAVAQDSRTPGDAKKSKQAWSGQGIPNTTTKYKEDQRVKWYGSPFEARLEKALHHEAEQRGG